jgi:hypothetical protein
MLRLECHYFDTTLGVRGELHLGTLSRDSNCDWREGLGPMGNRPVRSVR